GITAGTYTVTPSLTGDTFTPVNRSVTLGPDATGIDFTVTATPTLSVTVTSPADNAVVSGTVSITANASASQGVAGIQFMVNGANLGTEDTASPYSASWNTAGYTNGTYALTARVRDTGGNILVSAP